MRGNQWFKYEVNKKRLYHKVSNMCLDCDVEKLEIFMSPCDESIASQRWDWTTVNVDVMKEWDRKQLEIKAAKLRHRLSI